MIVDELMMHVEALVFASDKAITALDLTTLVAELHPDSEVNIDQINSILHAIKEKYDSEYYPFTIKEIGGGFQFLTKKEFHTTIAKLNGDKFLKRLSTAALETLAIIAYKQPITKPDVEYIRGVNCDYSVQKLLEKELIVISGRNEDAVGKPLLYSTSKNFMDYLGINSIDDLPRLKEVVGENIVIPTNADQAIPALPATQMVISTDGELVELPVEPVVNEDVPTTIVENIIDTEAELHTDIEAEATPESATIVHDDATENSSETEAIDDAEDAQDNGQEDKPNNGPIGNQHKKNKKKNKKGRR
jgi:segregation and condensation protein B